MPSPGRAAIMYRHPRCKPPSTSLNCFQSVFSDVSGRNKFLYASVTASKNVCSDVLCTCCMMSRCCAAIRSSSAVISSAVCPLMARLCKSVTNVRSRHASSTSAEYCGNVSMRGVILAHSRIIPSYSAPSLETTVTASTGIPAFFNFSMQENIRASGSASNIFGESIVRALSSNAGSSIRQPMTLCSAPSI